MKQLISLSLKYVRRQKLRSLLMFLCITLSVFVLNTFIVYSTSVLRTAHNEAVYERGAWEVEASGLFEECDNGAAANISSFKEAVQMAAHHIAVDELFYDVVDFSNLSSVRSDDGRLGFYEVTFDNGEVVRTQTANHRELYGDPEIAGEEYGFESGFGKELTGDAAVVPAWFRDLGYSEGDKLTLSIRMMSGVPDPDGENVRAVYDFVEQENAAGNGYTIKIYDEPGADADDYDPDVYSDSLLMMYKNNTPAGAEAIGYSGLELTDIEYGEPVTVTLTIAGFNENFDKSYANLLLDTGMDSGIDFSVLDGTLNGRGYGDRYSYKDVFMVMNQNHTVDVDMEMLLADMGFEGETVFEDAVDDQQIILNGFVNTVGFRTAQSIGDYSILISAYLILMLIVWLMARFVIDNAFEISVQQRSSQFAALRIMGASRGQLTALVLTEGLFYSFTAIPVGIIASALMCRSVFASFRSSGFSSCEFYMHPLATVIGIVLCFAGIIISSYTSAMWASRKLSPAEVLSYGKPKSTKKRLFGRNEKKRKSKLKIGSKRFMARYTMKNIFRTKKRFFIATIAMALGVLMFTFCIQLGLFVRKDIDRYMHRTEGHDFEVWVFDRDSSDVLEILRNSGNFTEPEIDYSGGFNVTDKEDTKKLSDLSADIDYDFGSGSYYIYFDTCGREEFESEGISELLGMTYDEFNECDRLYYVQSVVDWSTAEYDSSGEPIPFEEPHYISASDLGFGDVLTVSTEKFSEPVNIGGVVHAGTWSRFIAPRAYIEKLTGGEGKTIAGLTSDIYVSVVDTEHYEAALEDLDGISELLSGHGGVNNEYMEHTGLRSFIISMIKLALTFMVSVWLTGIFSMMNTINTSVINRSSELLMMRSVGMTKRQLYGNVILESALFSAFSTIIGTLVSMGVFYWLIHFESAYLEYHYTGLAVATMAISLAVNVLVSLFAAIPALRTLTRSINQHIS